MPELKIHEEESVKQYGKPFTELHQWMDAPVKVLHYGHRKVRHDPKVTPLETKNLFGENADHACLDHIILDLQETENKINYSKTISGKSTILSVRIPKDLNDRLIELSLFLDKCKSTVVNDMLKREMIDLIDMVYWSQFEEKLVSETKEFFYGKSKSVKDNPSLIYERDKGQCRKCGSTEGIMIYHIDGKTTNFSPLTNILICEICFNDFKTYMMNYANKIRFAAWLTHDKTYH